MVSMSNMHLHISIRNIEGIRQANSTAIIGNTTYMGEYIGTSTSEGIASGTQYQHGQAVPFVRPLAFNHQQSVQRPHL